MSGFESTRVLLRFHLAAGVRVALRATVPVATLAIGAVIFTDSGVALFVELNRLFFAPTASALPAVAAVLLCSAYSGWALRWVTGSLWGWIRHLPASGAAHRRAATAGLAVAQAPILALLLVSGLLTIGSQPVTTAPRLVGVLLLGWSAAQASLRGTRIAGRLLALVAGWTAFTGSWWLLSAAILSVAGADVLAGRIEPPNQRARAPRGRRKRPPASSWVVVARVWSAVTIRALRWRVLSTWWVAGLAWVSLLLFLNNNLSVRQEGIAVRLVGASAVVVMMASLADALAHKRPVWPWSRTLPWSAKSRVVLDAVILSTAAIPVLALGASLLPRAVPPIAATALLLAVRGAAAIREPFGTWRSPSAQLFVEGFIAAALVALVPLVSIGFLALLPLALSWGANAERGLKIGRWNERDAWAVGDSQSWGGR